MWFLCIPSVDFPQFSPTLVGNLILFWLILFSSVFYQSVTALFALWSELQREAFSQESKATLYVCEPKTFHKVWYPSFASAVHFKAFRLWNGPELGAIEKLWNWKLIPWIEKAHPSSTTLSHFVDIKSQKHASLLPWYFQHIQWIGNWFLWGYIESSLG